MDSFEDFAGCLVDSIVEYVHVKSFLEDLDLSVEDFRCDTFTKNGMECAECRCRIYNNLLEGDDNIYVSVSLWNSNSYIIQLVCPNFNQFGLVSLMSSFMLNYSELHRANVTVEYLAKVDSSDMIVKTISSEGKLVSYESNFTSSVSRSGAISFTDNIDYAVVLDLYSELLSRSDSCLGIK